MEIEALVKNRGEGPKGGMERRQQSSESRNLGGDKDDPRGRPQKQRQWWGGRPPRLMFEKLEQVKLRGQDMDKSDTCDFLRHLRLKPENSKAVTVSN